MGLQLLFNLNCSLYYQTIAEKKKTALNIHKNVDTILINKRFEIFNFHQFVFIFSPMKGFSLSGGSVTKIIYRSKLDYTDGKPNHVSLCDAYLIRFPVMFPVT